MVRHPDEAGGRRREVVRDRVKFLLDYKWDGNQRQMARDLGVSQGLISKIINGLQGAGKRFLAMLARQQGVNENWLLQGEGPPMSMPPKWTLPVALGVLPGAPLDYPHLLTGQRHPVAEAFDRPSRYWLELQANSLLLQDTTLRLLVGDMLLMETDPAWTSRLDLIEGRLCGIRYHSGLTEPSYALGKLYRDSLGLVFDALEWTIRLAIGPSPALPVPLPTPPPLSPEVAQTKKKIPRRRHIRPLEREAAKADAQRLAQEQGGRQEDAPAEVGRIGEGSLENIVGVCVYMARPSPGLARDVPRQ